MTSPRSAGLGGWRRTAHGLAIVAGWLLFFWGWYRVLATTPDFSELRVLVLGAAIVVPVVTVSWILHNRGIHRRKGPRRSIPTATLAYGTDFNGREIVADFRALAQAQTVHIVIDGARKLYRPSPAGAHPSEGASVVDMRATAPVMDTRAARTTVIEGPGPRVLAAATADRTPALNGGDALPRP